MRARAVEAESRLELEQARADGFEARALAAEQSLPSALSERAERNEAARCVRRWRAHATLTQQFGAAARALRQRGAALDVRERQLGEMQHTQRRLIGLAAASQASALEALQASVACPSTDAHSGSV